jgi:ADP-ribosylglycohydrolase
MAAAICTLLNSDNKTIRTGETEKSSLLENIRQYSTGKVFDEVLQTVIKASVYKTLQLKVFGNAVETLCNAFWGFLNSDSFADGMRIVLELNGDVDTNAAVYGQIAGAYYGYEAITESWRKATYQEAEIKQLADKLIAMKTCPILDTRFEEDEIYENDSEER